jgi:hypothetical protein
LHIGFGILLAVIFVALLGFGIFNATQHYPYRMKLGHVYTRCEEAGDLETMSNCLTLLLRNMEEIGMTEGYDARFWPGPSNDLALDYANLIVIRDRARHVSENNEFENLAYQYAMTEMRDQLDVLSIDTTTWVNLHIYTARMNTILWGWLAWTVVLMLWLVGFIWTDY